MGFVYPYFLFGLIAAGIPIIIHLFNFRRFKRVYFTNVSLLRDIEIQSRKQNKLQNILLLALRCLTIALLVLLFANPYIKNDKNTLIQQGGNAVLVFVDNSFSMENTSNKGSLLDKAKAKAKEVVMQYPSTDVFCLMTQDQKGTHRHFVSRDKFLSLLSEVELSPASLPMSQIHKQAHRLLSTSGKSSQSCFFISDFQASQFDPNAFTKDSINDVYIPLRAENTANVFVDSLWFENNLLKADEAVEMSIRLVNHSDKEIEKLPIKLYVEDKQLSALSVDLAAMENKTVKMSFAVAHSGILHSKVSLLDSPVSFDDDFFFTLLVRERIKVLAINASVPNPQLLRLLGEDSDIEFANCASSSIDYASFSEQSLIILNGLKEISSGLAAELKDFVSSGGSLAIIPSKDMDLESYNGFLRPLGLPAYSSMVEAKERVSEIDTENKLFKGVFTSVTDNMEMPTVKKYFPLSANRSGVAQSVMRLSGGEDFLVVSPQERSEVYLFASALEEDWSDITNQSIFVPIFWNMCAMSRKLPPIYYSLGEDSFIDLSAFTNISSNEVLEVKALSDSLSFIPQISKQNRQIGLRLNGQTKQADNYSLYRDNQVIGGFSLNYPRSESRLEFLSEGEIEAQLKDKGLDNARVFSSRALIESGFAKSDMGFSFSWILITLIIISITAEIYLLHKIKNQ